jgi:hypothetical protein
MNPTDPNPTITIEVPVNMASLLSAVWDGLDAGYSPWLRPYSFDWDNNDGTESVTVTYENPDADGDLTTVVTPQMLLEAFGKMVGQSLWGSSVSVDPEDMDALQADTCLQIALFGKEVYA